MADAIRLYDTRKQRAGVLIHQGTLVSRMLLDGDKRPSASFTAELKPEEVPPPPRKRGPGRTGGMQATCECGTCPKCRQREYRRMRRAAGYDRQQAT